jgi:hypothetical protein
MLIGYGLKHSGSARLSRPQPDEYKPPRSFRGVNTAQLPEHHEPAVSVTEHTTRTLDEVSIQRR